MAPHIALHEIGIPFESRPVLIPKGEHKRPDYLALNPEGKIPTFLIDGRVMTEVAAILWYLARSHPEAGLLPAGDIEAEAQVISWMSFCASTLHPARRTGPERWREVFALAEKKLDGREWAVDRYSIADIHLFRLFWRFVDSEHPARSVYPGLLSHYERMMARPAVARTLAIERAAG
jgi:glutathione S-transferase